MTHTMLDYPQTRRSDTVDTLHGIEVPDPYRWLEDIDSEQTQAWIAEQNQLTFGYLSQIPAQEQIAARIAELWNYEKYDPPFKRGGRHFFTRNDGLQNQSVLYWIESLEDQPRVLLDPNLLSEDGTVALTSYAVSEDGKLLAYGLSTAGSDWQEWRIRVVDSGQDLEDHLEWVKFSDASWAPDNQGFYYSRYDEPEEGTEYKGANYYHKLYYHRIGTSQSADELDYARPDQKEWGFGGQVTEDGHYLVITVWIGTHRENGIFYQDLETERGPIVELLADFDALYDVIGNDGPIFYCLTDLDAPMSKVIAIDITQPEPENWREVIPESEDALQTVSLIGDRFVATYLHDAHSRVVVFDKAGHNVREVELPGIGTVVGFYGRQADNETFYLFTGFATPGGVYHYDMDSGKATVFRQPELDFDPGEFVTEQVFYPSRDGTPIPMFISHKKGLKIDGNTPTYLYGYGGFNIAMTPQFRVSSLVWMEMGGIYAQANLRGGGEYGKPWHEAGMKLKKQNVFDDFIAAAEWLIEKGYTCQSRLAIAGGSNGGLLVGACMTQRPDLFGVCLPVVGVLDMLRFHEFTIGWAWTSDYGSPEDPKEFEALLAYSPYHNLKPGTSYPATLIATGDHDDRVFPAHSFKFAAALQAAQAGPAPVLIRVETDAGHGLGKPTSKLIEEAADLWAFVGHQMGIAPPKDSASGQH
jgi:prolyl oligopeptidase